MWPGRLAATLSPNWHCGQDFPCGLQAARSEVRLDLDRMAGGRAATHPHTQRLRGPRVVDSLRLQRLPTLGPLNRPA